MKISGSVAIVTGGARGLGKAFSEALLERGCKVCFVDVNEDEGLATQQSLRQKYGDGMSMFIKCDVTSQSDIEAVFSQVVEKYKTVDIMVNNAGIQDEKDFQKTVDINLVGVMRGSMLAFEHMRKDKGGQGGLVVNIASQAGLECVFFMPVYSATKHGVVGFTRSLATSPSNKKYGVSFALLCPAFVETKMLADAEFPLDSDELSGLASMLERTEKNTVDEVAAAFIELVEKEDNNGAILSVSKAHGVIYVPT